MKKSREVFAFAVQTFDPYTDKKTADIFMDAVNRTVGMIGIHRAERGILLVYDSLEHAEEAWFKVGDRLRVANSIMRGQLTSDLQRLDIEELAKSMRLTINDV